MLIFFLVLSTKYEAISNSRRIFRLFLPLLCIATDFIFVRIHNQKQTITVQPFLFYLTLTTWLLPPSAPAAVADWLPPPATWLFFPAWLDLTRDTKASVMLTVATAEVSMYIKPDSAANFSAVSVVTSRRSVRSLLFPGRWASKYYIIF